MNKTSSDFSLLKKTSSRIILIIVFFLMFFPLINTFNEFLIKVIEPLIFFEPFQKVVIPYEVRLVRVILEILNIPIRPGSPNAIAITLVTRIGEEPIVVAWNCIGWQSLMLILASLIVGLEGKYTLMSKIESLVIAILGTFLFNIGRISFIFVLYYLANRRLAMFFHDYLSVILTMFWLVLLWYYLFNFVLIPKKAKAI